MAKKSKNPLPVAGRLAESPKMEAAESKKYKDEEKRWRAEDDLRTMQRVKEIESDKSRVTAMKALAKEQMANLKKVCK